MPEPAENLPVIDETLCTGCGACVTICPTGAIIETQNLLISLVVSNLCTRCGDCETACPAGAISVPFNIGWAEG